MARSRPCLRATDRTARDVMSAPLVTVTEETSVCEIARLFAIHHFKRVPVVRDGRVVGIVSRADLLHAMAAGQFDPAAPDQGKHHRFRPVCSANAISRRGRPWRGTCRLRGPQTRPGPARRKDFQHLVEDFRHGEAEHEDTVRRVATQQRRERAKALIELAYVRRRLARSRCMARAWRPRPARRRPRCCGFLAKFCIDGGRAINVAEPDWLADAAGSPARSTCAGNAI